MKKEKPLVIDADDRFAITEKGKKYLRREKTKESMRKKIIKK